MKEKFYFHRDYEYDEYEEVYPHLTPSQIQEVYHASYEVALVYNFNTHKWELP